MTSGQLIVLERDGHWATALRRELDSRSPKNESFAASEDCRRSFREKTHFRGAKGDIGLRRELAATSVRLIETRSWDDCWPRLVQFPAALVAAELTESNVGQLLAAIARVEREFPAAALIVVAERRLAYYRGLTREAGALHFITSPRRLAELADILARRSGKLPTTPIPTGRIDEILADLPWSDSVE